MPNTTITNLTEVTLPDGTEEAVLNKGGLDRKITLNNIRGIIKVKPADEIVNNSNVLQNDSDLFFSVGANEIYFGVAYIIDKSGLVPDFQYAFSVPTGATGIHGSAAWNAGANMNTVPITTTTTLPGGNATQFIIIPFMIVVGATGGTVTFQWSQQTPTAEDTIVMKGSMLKVTRLL